ncbi:MAG: DUF2231 domain-containing protein [Bacteroidota bacterium]
MMAWHPLTVHFPIAWLILAGIAYAWRVYQTDHGIVRSAPLIHAGATLATGMAILSGRGALDDAGEWSAVAEDILNQHEIGAYVLLWANLMLLLWVYLRYKRMNGPELWVFLLVFWGMLAGLMYQAHLGGQMVYLHGVGVGGQ